MKTLEPFRDAHSAPTGAAGEAASPASARYPATGPATTIRQLPTSLQGKVGAAEQQSAAAVLAKRQDAAARLVERCAVKTGAAPLLNSAVGALAGGALGYGGGMLAEQLLPQRYLRRGKLRKTLGLLGAGVGAVPGLAQAYENSRLRATPGGPQLGMMQALITPNERVPIDSGVTAEMDNLLGTFPKGASSPAPTQNPVVDGIDKRVNFKAAKAALGNPVAPPEFRKSAADMAGGTGLRTIPVDAFNQVIWNDVSRPYQNPFGTKSVWGDNEQPLHTPPALAAATAGIVGGVSDMYGGASVLHPKHFMYGLAAAGVDLATANLVGGVLGALGGLTPEAQNKLQDMGIWGGLLRGTVGSMLSGR